MKEKRIFDYVRNIDSILIINGGENQVDKTFFYLTGAKSGIFEGSILHVKPEKITIITSALEEEAAKETGFDVLVYNTVSERNEILKNAFKNDVNVGLNYSALTLELYKQLMKIIPDKEFIDVSQSIDEARKIKEESELKNLREAAKIASDSFQDFIKSRVGDSAGWSCTSKPTPWPRLCMNLPGYFSSIIFLAIISISLPLIPAFKASLLSCCASLTVSYISLCFSSALPNTTVLVVSEQYLLYSAP